jgi:hypothetical protein
MALVPWRKSFHSTHSMISVRIIGIHLLKLLLRTFNERMQSIEVVPESSDAPEFHQGGGPPSHWRFPVL